LKVYHQVLIVLILIGGLAAWITSYLITKPLYKLSRTARELSSGHYDSRVNSKSHDEIGQLGSDFDNMAEKLEDNITELRMSMEQQERFMGSFAHELKTPLAVTKACVENWEYIDEKDRHEYSEKIISEVDHMASMITKLLELSKLNGGHNSINREEFDILKLTKTVYERMDELAKERHLEVTITDYDNIGEYIAYADPEMMNIVIGNFISNAITYSDTYIRMTVSDLGKKIEFRITNDGARIESKDLAKVWDVFYKTDEARTDRISSSGVGLAVVKSILDMHKAKYGCTSTYNSTTFYFLIDKAKDE
jgi:signal transduction histidine kinase